MIRRRAAVVLIGAVCVIGVRATPAAAFNPLGAVCAAASLANGILGKACTAVQNAGRLATAAKKVLGGHIGSAVKTALGTAGKAAGSHAAVALSLAAIGAWVLGGAKLALREASKVISETTTPQLRSSWFSATYWRVAGIAALLTLPFLFAAVVQALVRSDLALLLRTVLGYLPLALLMVSIAAPVTTLLLSGSDELSHLVSSAAGEPGASALGLGGALGGLAALGGSPFLLFFLGLLTVAGAMTLWLELLIREAAVYVVVLMLPLAFAALVWPARRAWAIRAVELLVALILSKFAMVAVLSLGGAAMDQAFGHSLTAPLVGLVLVMMGAFAPWVLLRLVPLADMASAAAGSLRGEARLLAHAELPLAAGVAGEVWAARTTSDMQRVADEAAPTRQLPPAPRPSDGSAEEDADPEPENGGSAPPGAASDPPGDEFSLPPRPPDDGPDPPDRSPAGAAAAPASDSGPAPPPPKPENRPGRSPGLSEMWQQDDNTWSPLVLGPEGWPPRLWPPQPEAEAAGESAQEADLLPPGRPAPEEGALGERTELAGLPPADGLAGASPTEPAALPPGPPEPPAPPESEPDG